MFESGPRHRTLFGMNPEQAKAGLLVSRQVVHNGLQVPISLDYLSSILIYNMHTSMTQLFSHTIAHFTGPSFMIKANNQPYKIFLGLAYS